MLGSRGRTKKQRSRTWETGNDSSKQDKGKPLLSYRAHYITRCERGSGHECHQILANCALRFAAAGWIRSTRWKRAGIALRRMAQEVVESACNGLTRRRQCVWPACGRCVGETKWRKCGPLTLQYNDRCKAVLHMRMAVEVSTVLDSDGRVRVMRFAYQTDLTCCSEKLLWVCLRGSTCSVRQMADPRLRS